MKTQLDSQPDKIRRMAAIHLPRFLIQRRLRDDDTLAHKPVAIVRASGAGELIVEASRAALVEGISKGMSAVQARALCPNLRLLPEEEAGDRRSLEALAEALLALCPMVEPRASDGLWGLWADVSSAPLFGGEEGLLRRIVEQCDLMGFRASVVIAEGRFGSMALALHGGRSTILRGGVGEQLARLPLSALPCSEQLSWTLSSMGLSTLGGFAALPRAGIASRFGAEGILMHRLARGDDPTPLTPFTPETTPRESFALDAPAHLIEPVLFGMKRALDRLTARLCGQGLALARAELLLTLDSEHTEARERRVVLPLTRPTRSSRLLLDLFRERLSELRLPAPVTAIAVEALETAREERVQVSIGEDPRIEDALEVAMARLKSSLGEEALFCAAPVERHRPESTYEKRPFRPGPAGSKLPEHGGCTERPRRYKRAYVSKLLNGDESPRRYASRVEQLPPPPVRPRACLTRPTRLVEPPRPLDVELSPEGTLKAICIGPRRHAVKAAQGPERLQGEWWQSTYARDYYRTFVAELGECWIFRDRQNGMFYLHGHFD